MSAPWRRDFDAARDPYAARNALGILPPVAGAPTSAEYVTASADATLTNERVLTNTATITWDFSTAGQAKASAAGGGNVSNSGTPTAGQYGKWVTATTIQGVAPATVLSDIGAQPAGSYQPLDGDLTSLAGASATNAIYYRSAANTWGAVTIGANLSFSGGTLAATAGSGITAVAVQKFTTSGTYTPTSGMKFCIIECVGSGGGGGGASGAAGQYYVGAGGGSGGYSRKRATAAEIGASQTVTIGATGTPGIGAANGGAGGATNIGTLCVANGGGGGLFGSTGQVPVSGNGATPGTGDITAAGSPGMAGIYQQGIIAIGLQFGPCGNGGSSVLGGGAAGTTSSTAAVHGNNAGNYGSGGAGGSVFNSAATANGGNGSAGICIITEFI